MDSSDTRLKRPRRIAAWPAFAVMTLLGTLLAFSFLSFAGPLAWPFVLMLGGIAIWARPHGHAAFGIVTGFGVFLLFVAVIHLNSNPCPPSGTLQSTAGIGPSSCGGIDSKPWLIVGSAALVTGVALFMAAHRQPAGD
jgi:hypothetical protein